VKYLQGMVFHWSVAHLVWLAAMQRATIDEVEVKED
jgi:hypothetical protein